ncbi:nodulation protein NfeD [Paenibacillus sp. 481]|nr:nodulation protein NfeD [Paenibacillus sp. 481]
MLSMMVFGSLPIAQAMPSMMDVAAHKDSDPSRNVVVIPLQGTVDPVMKSFFSRAMSEAAQYGAELVILEMNTPGGYAQIAQEMGTLLSDSQLRTVMYVHGKAASAGSYLALNADEIAMAPGSAIGAAALVDGDHNYVDDPKAIAFWNSQMKSAAEKNGRNVDVAVAMADLKSEIKLPELGRVKKAGEVLSLSVQEARKVGYADYEAASVQDLLVQMKLEGANIVTIEPETTEWIASIITNPYVSTLLLFLGIAGVAIELLVPGFGLPGFLGVLGFGLYFFGHYVAGLAGMETVVLFIVGLVLLVLELFIPSFGILGILGSASLIFGVVRAAYDTSDAFVSLGIAFVAAVIVVVIVAKVFKHRGVWNRFILRDTLSTNEGYVSNDNQTALIGKVGTAITPLRPSGTVMIDGKHIDVVTDGTFIERDATVIVMEVEGARVVVRKHI